MTLDLLTDNQIKADLSWANAMCPVPFQFSPSNNAVPFPESASADNLVKPLPCTACSKICSVAHLAPAFELTESTFTTLYKEGVKGKAALPGWAPLLILTNTQKVNLWSVAQFVVCQGAAWFFPLPRC